VVLPAGCPQLPWWRTTDRRRRVERSRFTEIASRECLGPTSELGMIPGRIDQCFEAHASQPTVADGALPHGVTRGGDSRIAVQREDGDLREVDVAAQLDRRGQH